MLGPVIRLIKKYLNWQMSKLIEEIAGSVKREQQQIII